MSKKPEHYVDNQRFLSELKTYRVACLRAKDKKRDSPQMPEYIGECFLAIAKHLSFKPNFVNYTFRDDMISDGVENCLVYVHNFDPEKSSNPFGYFTQIIYYAFIRRIQREKKHTYIRYKMIEQSVIAGGAHEAAPMGGSPVTVDSNLLKFDNVKEFITKFDDYTRTRRERRRLGREEEPVAVANTTPDPFGD